MNFSDFNGRVDTHLLLLKTPVKTVDQAEEASNAFNLFRSELAYYYYEAEKAVGIFKGLEKAVYAEAFSSVSLDETGKKLAVNAREYEADRNPKYQELLVDKAEAEAMMSLIEVHLDIFKDAVISFRHKAERLGRNF